MDGCHESQDGRMGQEMRAEIERKMEKLQVRHEADYVAGSRHGDV